MKNERLGLFLMKMRLQRGLSRSQLAEALQVREDIVSSWELGHETPSEATLPSLIQVLNVTCEEFISHLLETRLSEAG